MNGTKVFIDTNICIYLLNGDGDLSELLDQQSIFISVITEIELFSAKSLTEQEVKIIKEFVESVNVIDISALVKSKTIEVRKSSKLKLPDSIIAASALANNLPFISSDTAFGKVEELELILYKKG